MRKFPKNALYDKLHKGFVLTCVGVTLAASCFIGIRAYHYFTVIRPYYKQLQLEKDQQLLMEGTAATDADTQMKT